MRILAEFGPMAGEWILGNESCDQYPPQNVAVATLSLADLNLSEPEPSDFVSRIHVSTLDGRCCVPWQADRTLLRGARRASGPKVKRICSTCPAGEECPAYALEDDFTRGVWGGTSREERRAMQGAADQERKRRFPIRSLVPSPSRCL